MKFIFLFTFLSSSLVAQLHDDKPVLSAEENTIYRQLLKLYEAEPQAALKLYEKVKPDASAAFDYLKGVIYMQQKHHSKAISSFEQAIKKLPDYYHAHQALVELHLGNDKPDKAMPHLLKTIQLGKANGTTWKRLAKIHLQQERLETAWHALQQVEIFLPQDKELANARLQIRLQQQKYPQAISMLKLRIDKKPGQRENWLWLIQSYLAIDKNDLALRHLQLFERLFKLNKKERLNLADLYYNNAFYKDAATHYQWLADKQQLAPQALLRCSRALLNSGNSDNVLQLLKAENSKWTAGQLESFHMIRAEAFLDKNQHHKALKEFSKVIKFNSFNTRAFYFIAELYRQDGKTAKALDFYNRASKDKRYAAAALQQSARLYMFNKQPTAATEAALRSLEYDNSKEARKFYEQIKNFSERAL